MKSSQKKWQPNITDSVIGMLMGFDEQPQQRLIPDKRRVLSESYIRNVASVSLRPGSLVSIGRSRSSNVVDKCLNSSSSNVRSHVSLEPAVSSSFSANEHCAGRHVLRHHQKLEHDFEYVKIDKLSRPEYREPGKSLMHEIGKPHYEFTYKELVVNGNASPGHSCVACTQSMSSISPPERRRSKFEDVLKAEYKDYGHDPLVLLDQSSLANKSRKKITERRKTAKRVIEFGVSGMARDLDVKLSTNNILSPSSLQSRSSDSSRPPLFSKSGVQTTLHKDFVESESGRADLQLHASLGVENTMSPSSNISELPSHDVFSSGSSCNNSGACIKVIQIEKDNCFENDDRCKEIEPSLGNAKSSINNPAVQYIHDASYDGEVAFNAEDSTRINGDPLLKSYPGILLEEDVHSSNFKEVFSKEASLDELSEEDSADSKCSRIGPLVSLGNLKRTSQHSPNSVLESHDTNNPLHFQCFDSIGLMLQLQALNFEIEESLSEESAIVVSRNEDLEESFGDLYHDGRKIKKWLGDEESRNFSYLVDVLDEAGLYDTNSFMDFNKWASLECPISPLMFDALEKKYGTQTSWQKSERLLLFDHINSGILSIYYPFINFHDGAISICKKLCASFRRGELEEELWTMLASQENEKSKDLSEKALDKWWEFKEGVSTICGELEASLFDELVVELATDIIEMNT